MRESDNDIDGYLAKQEELKASKKLKKIHTIEDSKYFIQIKLVKLLIIN